MSRLRLHFGGRGAWPWLLLAAAVITLDQATKALAASGLDYGRPLELTGFFNLTLVHNPGAAFSFLSDAAGWQRWFFAAVSLTVSAGILVWLWRLPIGTRLQPFALALILGGALGNLWDRLALGYVVDFIQLHYHALYWPAFNVADSAITVGAVLLIVDALLTHRSRETHE